MKANLDATRLSNYEDLKDGTRPLFLDPDAEKAREFFARKPRAITDKRMSLKEAIERFVVDGCSLGSGGFSTSRIPVAAMHEIVRQGKKNLCLFATTTSYVSDLLAIGRCFNRVDVSYVVGMEARGLSPNARRYLESGEVEVVEWGRDLFPGVVEIKTGKV